MTTNNEYYDFSINTILGEANDIVTGTKCAPLVNISLVTIYVGNERK